MNRGPSAGFTLIELLVVIGIIGVLAVVLLPAILEAGLEGESVETTARIRFLTASAKSFERHSGGYPPDDFHSLDGKAVAKDNGDNSGIESLVWFLCQRRRGRESLADYEVWLENTDGDAAAELIPELQRRDLMEVVDAWGMPLVYFCAQSSGYQHTQRVRTPIGEIQKVSPIENPRTGRPAGRFQLISAGVDGRFGTEDDITYPSFRGVE